MRFTNAYAGYTVCAPSRASFFSGRNSGHFDGKLVHQNWTLLPEVLQQSGYKTAVIGKAAPINLPTTRGYIEGG
jgi:arylsulfatase A-like enzyme